MTKGKKILAGVGLVVVAGIGVETIAIVQFQATAAVHVPHKSHILPSRKPVRPKQTTQKLNKSSSKTPTIPSAGQTSADSAQASLAAVTAKEGVTMPTGPTDIVANLATPAQHWAFATEAAKGASTGYTLTMTEYANNIAASSQAVAAMKNK